ncbi:MAG: YceI family protein [Terrimicrobiaceae bacterium]|nr:YceI family protein [Terrimicrobiaceae bacterium]
MLRTIVRLVAILSILSVTGFWFASGADRGWTKTSVTTMKTDEITGLEFPVIENRFVPGVDFLAAGLVGSFVLLAITFIRIPTKPNPTMKTPIITVLAVTALALNAGAAPITFDFKDPKGVNNIVFKLDAPLESINGTASGISGTITADPENPAAVTGKIVVDTTSLHVPNPVMKEHMHGEKWLDVTTHPQITFELKEVKNVTRDGNKGTADVLGTFTLKGISKDITVPVNVTYLPGKLKARGGDVDGDLLVVRSDFKINRSDFQIQAGQNTDKVAEDIEISLSLAGAAPKP